MKKCIAVLILLLSSLAFGQCAPQVFPMPNYYFFDAAGVQHQWLGIDITSADPVNGPSAIAGTPVICYRTYFNDTGKVPQAGKNAFVSINHLFGSGTLQTNQDRALWVSGFNNTNDTSAHYGMEVIQAELTINGSPQTMNGVDTEYSAGSFQTADNHTGTQYSPALGIQALRGSVFRNTTATWGSCANATCWAAARFYAQNTYAGGNSSGGRVAALVPIAININWAAIQPNDNLTGVGIFIPYSRAPFPFHYSLEIEDTGIRTNNYNIKSRSGCVGCGKNDLQGPVYAGQAVKTGKTVNTDFAGVGILPFLYNFQDVNTLNGLPPICVAADTTSANPVRVTISRTMLLIDGTTGDAVNYICVGRN